MFASPSKVFKAFTETVEALALQQSVIGESFVPGGVWLAYNEFLIQLFNYSTGNSHLKPASEEEVAKVIEETRRKLKNVRFADEEGEMEKVVRVSEIGNSGFGSNFVDTNVLERTAQSATLECADDFMVLDEEPAKRLVRIPPESLTKERKTKSKLVWNISPKERSPSNQIHDSELRRNILMKSFSAAPESTLEGESFEHSKQHTFHQQNSSRSEKVVNVKIVENLRHSSNYYEESDLQGKYEALLRERAHLEGRLDILQLENKELLEIRAGLEKKVADLAARIQ